MSKTVPRTGTPGRSEAAKRFNEAFLREMAKIGARVRWSPLSKGQARRAVRAGFKPEPKRSPMSNIPYITSKPTHSKPPASAAAKSSKKVFQMPKRGPNPLLKTSADRWAGMSQAEIEKAKRRAKYASIAKRRKLQEALRRLDQTSGSK